MQIWLYGGQMTELDRMPLNRRYSREASQPTRRLDQLVTTDDASYAHKTSTPTTYYANFFGISQDYMSGLILSSVDTDCSVSIVYLTNEDLNGRIKILTRWIIQSE